MTLIIEPDQEYLGLELRAGKNIVTKKIFSDRRRLMKAVVSFCEAQNIDVDKIDTVIVKGDKASFTNIRQATSLANIMRWLTGAKVGDEASVKVRTSYLTPHYSGEPNITKPKK